LPLAFEDGRIQITHKIISMLGNDVSNDNFIKVLCNVIIDFLFSAETFAIILLNCINSSPKSLSKSIL